MDKIIDMINISVINKINIFFIDIENKYICIRIDNNLYNSKCSDIAFSNSALRIFLQLTEFI